MLGGENCVSMEVLLRMAPCTLFVVSSHHPSVVLAYYLSPKHLVVVLLTQVGN